MQDHPKLTPALCRAARGLLNWSQDQLAERSHLGGATIRRFEMGRQSLRYNNEYGIRRAFIDAGVEFIPAPEGGNEGVRLRAGEPRLKHPKE